MAITIGLAPVATEIDANGMVATAGDVTYPITPADVGAGSFVATDQIYIDHDKPNGVISAGLNGGALFDVYAPSTSGESWSEYSTPAPSVWNDVVYAGGQFVVVGRVVTPLIMTSPDGITWTPQTGLEAGTDLTGITYGGGLYVAVGDDSFTTTVATSPDTIVWTKRTLSGSYYGVTYGNSIFVASGNSRLASSTDGLTWATQTLPESPIAYRDVCYSITLGLFVAVASTGTNRVATSPDGITWTGRSCPSQAWYSVACSNDILVAVSNTGTLQSMTSTNGIDWTLSDIGTGGSLDYQKIRYLGGLFVALHNDGFTDNFSTSADGLTWLSYSAPIDRLACVAADSSNYVVLSGISLSRDEVVITPLTKLPVTEDLKPVFFSDGVVLVR